MRKYLLIIRAHPRLSLAAVLALALIIAGFIFVQATLPKGPTPTTFGECAALYTVTEGSPRTCSVPWGRTFVEYTGNQNKFDSEIRLINLPPAPVITTSPFVVFGEAQKEWFSGSLTASLVSGTGEVIGTAVATRSNQPVATGFIGFTASIPFTRPTPGTQGALIFKNGASSTEALVLPVVY